MSKRFVAIWFRYLKTDWFTRRQPSLKQVPFVLASPDHGRMVIRAANPHARLQGIDTGMVAADARAIIPSLQILDDKPELSAKLLNGIGEWCIRYSPVVAVDLPDGLILDATGCAHLWKGETNYINDIITRLNNLGYHVHAAMADTIGAAWGVSRAVGQSGNQQPGSKQFGNQQPGSCAVLQSGHCDPPKAEKQQSAIDQCIIKRDKQTEALLPLSPLALRIDADIADRLQKLGLRQIRDFIGMPRSVLRRRFGTSFIKRLDQALGHEEEILHPVQPVEQYHERLPCLEPIVTLTGIEIALQNLLETLCDRLRQEEKGLRSAVLKCYRVDGKIEKIGIGTNRPSHNVQHLFKLFELKLSTIEPALGIELFLLEAPKVEPISPVQEKIWENTGGLFDPGLGELLDRLAGKLGADKIHRYLPDEHYWPERSVKQASSLDETTTTAWELSRPRPLHILSKPEPVEVTAPIPDYPPMLFRYKGKLHKINKADGPERIEQEWWLQQGQHRDYYYVEDEEGCRYWLFRLGHYSDKSFRWFIHGFFG